MSKNKTYKQKRPVRERVAIFMYGRNGIDKYGRFLFIVYFILVILTWIISIFAAPIVYMILSSLVTLLGFYIFFRAFSRNLVKRQAENYRFITVAAKFKSFISLLKSKFRDRKTHVFRKCPYCKAVLRLKRIKGKHRAACPRCGRSFDVKV